MRKLISSLLFKIVLREVIFAAEVSTRFLKTLKITVFLSASSNIPKFCFGQVRKNSPFFLLALAFRFCNKILLYSWYT